MRNLTLARAQSLSFALILGLVGSGCGADGGVTPVDSGSGTGGAAPPGTGGSPGTGGAPGTGGSTPGTGGATGTGGSTPVDAAPDVGPGDVGGGGDVGGPLNMMIVDQMRKVADWQLPRVGGSKDWIHGAMWTGIFATYQATKDEKYLTAIKNWAGAGWGLSGGAGARGDNQCAAQTFFDVYLLDPTPANMVMLNGAKPSFDAVVGENRSGRVEWWWEDALFMVPPGFVRLYAATKDIKYIDKMNTLWWDTYAYLWNNNAGLMYRDNGLRGNFWARGNGWVIAGTARVLQYLPMDNARRPDFIKMLQAMSAALAKVQGADGCWRSNLLNAGAIPNPETSGTGFFTYAMAWGINNGHLDKAMYQPIVQKGWTCLNSHVDAAGKLGYVQPVGAGPAPAGAGSTVEYGVGAYLLAGSEMAKLQP